MGTIIKNQILKHLSKFTKNLSPDKINISTLKGEGELSNLELDENILMELLELPTWMKLNKAVCNKVSIKIRLFPHQSQKPLKTVQEEFRLLVTSNLNTSCTVFHSIQWTKLKSQPICLFLDEVVLEIETCAEPRPPNSPTQQSSYRAEGRYGFVDKVIDGMYVHINSVSVQFMSQKFHASLQLSRVKVQSLTPNWGQPTDLRQSRIRDETNDQILLFKEVDWQTTRIEAIAHEDESSIPSTPLRLIANQSKVRIVFKKKLSDCSMIASRVIFLLDDILWVLTDTQLKAAILYANSLRDMIKKSAEQSKRLAADKLQKQGHMGSGGVTADQLLFQQQQQQQQKGRSQTSEQRLFQKFDVATTSYHLITCRIDLHLCDDTPTDKESSPKHNRQIDGGAMQITFCKLSVDYYPFHLAGGERKNWYRYTDNQGSRNSWVQELFKVFRAEVSKARETCKVISPSQSPAHNSANLRSPSRSQTQQSQSSQGVRGQGHSLPRPRNTKLLESCMVLRIEEFIIYRVSTADNKRSSPQKFFSSDKKALHLPADMSMVHIEYTDYFFTEGIDYPVPHSNLYVLINPVRLSLDFLTVLWANYFSLNLAQMVETQEPDLEQLLEHIDIKIEALMPRIVLAAEEKVENQPERPESIQIQISKLTASNTHSENRFTLDDLKGLLKQYDNCDMFSTNEFPNDKNKVSSIPKVFHDFAHSHLNPFMSAYAHKLVRGKLPDGLSERELGTDSGEDPIKLLLRTNTLKRDARCDMWGVCIDQVWLEFLGVPTSRTRPIPFVESVPLTLWICRPSLIPDGVVSPSNSDEGFLISGEEVAKKRKGRQSTQLLKKYYSDEGDEDSCAANQNGDDSCHSNNVDKNESRHTEQICDKSPSSDGIVQYTSLQLAAFNIVAKIGGKIRAQLNHPQYLFLMRLVDSISNFQSQLNVDVDNFLKGGEQTGSTSSFSIPLVIPELEFAMVCPYIAELLPLSNPADLLNSPLTESSEGREVYGDTDSDLQGETEANACNMGNDEEMLVVTESQEGSKIEMNTQHLYPDNYLSHSQSDSTLMCHTLPQTTGVNNQTIPGIRRDSHSTDDISQTPESNLEIMGQNICYTASDSGISSLGSSLIGQRPRANSKLTPTSMKKSFTSGMTNFMGKIKNKLDPDDADDMDSMSIKTDASDDDLDFEYLSLDDNEAPAFNHGQMSETTSSTDTDDLSSVFADSTSASRAKELVSAIVFRLCGTELLIQSCEDNLLLRLQTQAIDCEETGNIVYEDFYSKLSSSHGIIKQPMELENKYPIKFKYSMGPCAEKEAPRGGELGVMDARIRNYKFKFLMSSITNMTNFIEDEKTGTPMPMHVTVDNLKLTLQEDSLPANSSSQIKSEPVLLNIHNLLIRRHDDGVFHMTTGDNTSVSDLLPRSSNNSVANPVGQMNLINHEDHDSEDEADTDLTNLPAAAQEKIKALQNKNKQLQLLLEKLDNHTQQQEQHLEKYSKLTDELDDTQNENKLLRDKLKTFALSSGRSLDDMDDLRRVNTELESENSKLLERVVTLEDELKNVMLEKESFMTTMQLLQDELTASEQHRHRRNTGNSDT